MSGEFVPQKSFFDKEVWDKQDFDASSVVLNQDLCTKHYDLYDKPKRYYTTLSQYYKDSWTSIVKCFEKYKELDREQLMMVAVRISIKPEPRFIAYAKKLGRGYKRSCGVDYYVIANELTELLNSGGGYAVYFIHNHPSGSLTPSRNDLVCLNNYYILSKALSDRLQFGDFLIYGKGTNKVWSAAYEGYLARLKIRLRDFNLADDNYEADQKLKQELEVYLKQFENNKGD